MRWIALLAISSAACFSDPGGVGGDPTASDDTGEVDSASTNVTTTGVETGSGSGSSSEETSEGSESTGSACDPAEGPGEGIFVSTHGDDLTGQGTAVLPFASIAAGIEAAVAAGADAVYLDEGTYAERIVVPETGTGLRIEGGFIATGASWTRDCDPGVVGRTVVASPAGGAAAVQVFGVTHASRLVRLTIATASQDQSPPDLAGDSRIGVHVVDSVFALEAVDVLAGRAADGGPASVGVTGSDAPVPGESPSCLGLGDCSDGLDGDDGPSPGDAAPSSGSFDAQGFAPADGNVGLDAATGHHGLPSAVGPQSSTNCHENCGCNNNQCTDTGAVLSLSGGAGRCGCGGEGGGGGAAGRGGGASVALLVAGARTTVSVSGGSLRSHDAGHGSPGGAGGPGGAGSVGVAGGMQNCHGGCGTGGGPCQLCGSNNNNPLMGGQAGGTGGAGGEGSRGGGGAGGDSYAIVRIAGAVVVVDPDATALSHGEPGSGVDGAPDGSADIELVVD